MENSLFWLPDKMTGKSVSLPGNKKVEVDIYERNIEADIRKLKSRLKLLISARNHMQDKLDCLKRILQNASFLVQKRCIQRKTPRILILKYGNRNFLTKTCVNESSWPPHIQKL